ncbi:sex hormone-binding globulin isoform X1 [Corythoichthys intestinalis]|uniref:sex hormone-binding globulin isoform X1 n=1 Tax=Corythoichthys intestinalis TaxID=161448 RepID=UPI0025A642E6|nr:sex hormone-binding globulin isoform X1 [Corythoichthys intestinalis]
MASGPLLLTLSITALAWGIQAKKEISGSTAVDLGQHRDAWRPLMHLSVNLTKIRGITSTFQLRTYDPEGTIFYGDTKNGRDWFILALKDGVPLMQISRSGVLVFVVGGPKLNDGRWHTLELSNHGDFVVLEVDGSRGLLVGLQSDTIEEVVSGSLRLAIGGILIPKERLFVQLEPQLDACVRDGSWLNLSNPWETDAEQLRPCRQNIRPGSFFSGSGMAVVNSSAVLQTEYEHGVTIRVLGDFAKMDGTILSIRPPGQALMFAVVADNNTKEVTVILGGYKMSLKEDFKELEMTFGTDWMEIRNGGHASKVPWENPELLKTLRESHVAIGGLPGKDDAGSSFLRGCLEKIQIQGKDVDLDGANKHPSISSHSCPL